MSDLEKGELPDRASIITGIPLSEEPGLGPLTTTGFLREVTARLMVESVRLGGYLRLVGRSVQVPVLLLLAGEDRIIDNARTQQFVERFSTTDKTVIEYPGAHHTLEFEPEPDQFVADWQQWLERFDSSGGR